MNLHIEHCPDVKLPLRRHTAHIRSDEAGIVVVWLLKVLLLIAAVGLVLIEGGGLLLARYTVSDASEGAASQGAFELRTKGESARPEAAVREYLQEKDAELVSLAVDRQARTVTVVTTKTAKTFVVHRIEPLKRYTVATDTHSVSYGG